MCLADPRPTLVRIRFGWEWQEAQSISGLTKTSFFLRKKSSKASVTLHLFWCSTTCDLNFMVQDGAIHIPDSKIGKAQRKGNAGHTLSRKEGSGKDHMLTYFPLTGI